MPDFKNDIEQCLRVLEKGGIILYPTDTIWGMGCDATNEEAVKKIYEIKKRPDEKSLIVLVRDEKQITQWVRQPDPEVFDYLRSALKPTTVIYENAIGLAGNLTANDNTIAIRICKDKFCFELLSRFNKPIVSTSANVSGQEYPRVFSEISNEIKENVDYVVSYRRDDKTVAEPSALIKWLNGKAIILRH